MTTCTHCGEIFTWTETPEGYRPINKDGGLPHWRTCKGFRKASRNKWKARKRQQQIQKRRDRPHPPATTGAPVQDACAGCTALPWEHCPCTSKEPGKTTDNINDEADLRMRFLLAEQA